MINEVDFKQFFAKAQKETREVVKKAGDKLKEYWDEIF